MNTQDTVLVTGFAQGPRGTTIYETHKTIGVVLVINVITGRIQEAEFTVNTELLNLYLKDILKGYNIHDGIQPLLEQVKQKVLIPSQGAVVQALRSAADRYQEARNLNKERWLSMGTDQNSVSNK
ncbi:DUF3870 domain-containing protein [Peribacillus saganii]|uniref:DUF3870 domain-containing protein n=1 Tax=Peribacillus saganii TaxID=2303992 RepID=A0A372LRT2_9BACI|nr:DUF3870 domain-containing protein [Peribacillus saganii]RFU70903.1 DUF3870 domain-containing protein [Peribacillus saganii]